MMKRVVQKFGPDLCGFTEMFPGAEFSLNTKCHCISLGGAKDLKPKVQEIICVRRQMVHQITRVMRRLCARFASVMVTGLNIVHTSSADHAWWTCVNLQLKFRAAFRCVVQRKVVGVLSCSDFRSLLLGDKFEELFRASLAAFVSGSGGIYRFCRSPDCSSVYGISDSAVVPFLCGACYAETCTRCHLEYRPFLSCEQYKEFKGDPVSSLKAWCAGKVNVKKCPVCSFTIEKVDRCNHIEGRCGR